MKRRTLLKLLTGLPFAGSVTPPKNDEPATANYSDFVAAEGKKYFDLEQKRQRALQKSWPMIRDMLKH